MAEELEDNVEVEETEEEAVEEVEETEDTASEGEDTSGQEEGEGEDDTSESGKEEEPDLVNMPDEEYLSFLDKQLQPKKPEKPEKPQPAEQKKPVKRQQAPASVDYKAFYDEVMKPFTSSGRTVTPRDVSDIRSLMQMGTDYTRKTQALSPMRRIAETVRAAQIDEENLNTLINAFRGDRTAIKALLKKHNIEPSEIDLEEEDKDYVPRNNIANDQQLEFAEILEDINPSLDKIREVLDKKWDAKSRQQLLENPKLFRGLHEEMEMGRFEAVQQVVESEKALGRYRGQSDLEAYIDIVSKYTAYEAQKAQQKSKAAPKAQTNKAKAAPVRSTVSGKKSGKKLTDQELLRMNDEDFMRLSEIV